MSRPSALDACASSVLGPTDQFVHRHIGPSDEDVADMLREIGCESLDDLLHKVIPDSIRMAGELDLPCPAGEHETIERLRAIAEKNVINRSYIGMGYVGTITPPVIARNVLENPGWYTQYTPYQAEIAQGRLEALLNFQTMISDLTGMEIAGASLLDEATAAAEAMAMCVAIHRGKRTAFIVDTGCHPQTIAVMRTRAGSMGFDLIETDAMDAEITDTIAGVLVQLPTTDGRLVHYESLAERAHGAGALVVCAADLLALAMIEAPGSWGADIVVGSAQRFGVPMGFGGPHAGYLATSSTHVRKMPGRIVGVSHDAQGNTAYRLTIQTREQHIKRDRATSNICTAQALLAIMAGMYAVYHGPKGLRAIAERTNALTRALAVGLQRLGHSIGDDPFFDTLRVRVAGDAAKVLVKAAALGINLRDFGDGSLGITLDETVTTEDVQDILKTFGADVEMDIDALLSDWKGGALPAEFERTTEYLTHPVFNSYHSETEMLRYLKQLENKDLSLAHSMIPLGSCTMKLNATSEMLPVTWPKFANLHPFAPKEQTRGSRELCRLLEAQLAEITGLPAVSLQPNSGAQGEYAGLLVIRSYLNMQGQGHRNVCLIPVSSHGTNPASAIIAGMKVVAVRSNERGEIDVAHLREMAEMHKDDLAALMVTYPSTHGVFEAPIREICDIVHEFGGQVYMDGANMNAQVGVCRPGEIGADVCHLNLHKTFCIPHGGGGPGVGPIAVAEHLAPFLPGHPVTNPGSAGASAIGPVSAAPEGSAGILPISWVYIAMMGAAGLKRASQVAILNANYMARRLGEYYDLVYTGNDDRVAHEFILDCRPFEKSAGIRVDDLAKRLMDYGFHAPTMSWPVAGTLMVEPTESESKAELDRFCDAMISIRQEIAEIERGDADREINVLKGSPHTVEVVGSDTWDRPYSRQRAAWPARWLHTRKFWPAVGRIDNPYGDRNLMCSCPCVDDLAE
ncbi:MAG TPA: glycine dehydrogenase (aminomethyl-transferring) [Phycisphaerales bacterium]|nr:glycine dehydrogenase (aminomethyl-transferring) [Phycisphaerales bacterium]